MTPSLMNNDLAVALLTIGVLFVHSSYQLSVSVLSYMSGHALGQRTARKRLASLGAGYSLGVTVMVFLILLSIVVATNTTIVTRTDALKILTVIVASVVPLVGLFTILTYYRKGTGTKLWLPRPFADYLLWRARKTKSSVEAFSLGATTVVGELPFVIGPLLIAAVVIAYQHTSLWIVYGASYALLSTIPVIIISILLAWGVSPAQIQRWREQNKTFFQWTSGILLVLLTVYLVVMQIGEPL